MSAKCWGNQRGWNTWDVQTEKYFENTAATFVMMGSNTATLWYHTWCPVTRASPPGTVEDVNREATSNWTGNTNEMYHLHHPCLLQYSITYFSGRSTTIPRNKCINLLSMMLNIFLLVNYMIRFFTMMILLKNIFPGRSEILWFYIYNQI